MTTALLACFLTLAVLLWVSSIGYLCMLACLALWRTQRDQDPGACPPIAMIIPTLNEERQILGKLADLRLTDYPRERMTVLIVDGGSRDRTVELIEEAIRRGEAVRLLSVPEARSKAEQVNRALGQISEDLVVITDADARLAPSCVREMVDGLSRDPSTALLGAVVRPDTPLLEERLHWRFVNWLWWLEGEGLSSAMISGVCYALRRSAVDPLAVDAATEDVHLALAAGARGRRVRLCRRALATEVRVPHDAGELLAFRNRRGANYLRELRRRTVTAGAPVGWRIARRIRLWHFLATPILGLLLAVTALYLLWTPHWHWPILAFSAFAAPALAALYASSAMTVASSPVWVLGMAALRLAGLTWIVLLSLDRGQRAQVSRGASS